MLLKGPLKKGDVRQSLDKRIEKARKELKRLDVDAREHDVTKDVAVLNGQVRVLQNVRKELFGERLSAPGKLRS